MLPASVTIYCHQKCILHAKYPKNKLLLNVFCQPPSFNPLQYASVYFNLLFRLFVSCHGEICNYLSRHCYDDPNRHILLVTQCPAVCLSLVCCDVTSSRVARPGMSEHITSATDRLDSTGVDSMTGHLVHC